MELPVLILVTECYSQHGILCNSMSRNAIFTY